MAAISGRAPMMSLVCTENPIRLDLMTETPNVSDDGHVVVLLACAARRAV